ncbi:polyprenyl synthetase family protein [Thermogutta sp.]|uniref:polyprenyl synthetase family protein n=1 Tax=Thermogutta sp. TaxID=1962930 RepID=UPI003C7A23A7
MADVSERVPASVKSLQEVYEVIADEMAEVDRLLRQELQNSSPFIDGMLKHGLQLGGKRLRPALVLLSGKLCGKVTQTHLLLATALELVHTASLVHDDVLDEAQLRRHMETMNARWDNSASVLLGDYLLARALCLASSLDSVVACREIAQASHRMCQGELRQIAACGRFDMSEEEYLEIIAEKTAALCQACCRLGAYYADAPPPFIEDLGEFGLLVGVAFQIIDDILDILGDEEKTGKSLGSDLAKQKPTLPIIHMLRHLSEPSRERIIGLLREQPPGFRHQVRQVMLETGSIDYAREKAAMFISDAVERLDDLPVSPASESLRQLAAFVIARDR